MIRRSPAVAPWMRITRTSTWAAAGRIQVERRGSTLHGAPGSLLRRLRQDPGSARSVRRVVAGTISVRSNRVHDLQLAGHMLIVTVTLSPSTRVHVVSTNRLP